MQGDYRRSGKEGRVSREALDFQRTDQASERCQPRHSLRAHQLAPQLGTGGAARATPMSWLAVLGLDCLAHGAAVIIVEHVSVTLANGIPGGDLRHRTAFRKVK